MMSNFLLLEKKHWGRFLVLIFLLPFIMQCKRSDDFGLSLAVNADTIHVDTAAGKTHIMVYSTGDWTAAFEKDSDWISLDKTKGHGNSDIVFSYSKNFGASRTATLVLTKGSEIQEIQIVQAGIEVELRFSQSKYTIPKQGLKTTLPVISNLKGDYKTVEIEHLYDDETMEKWVTKDSLTADGFIFNALDNNSGRKRSVRIYLTIIDAMDVEHTAFADIDQTLTSAFLQEKYNNETRVTKDARIDTVIMDGNVGAQFPAFQTKITYAEGSEWIEDVTLTDDSLMLIAIRENTSGENRSADIQLSLSADGQELVNLTHHVFQSNSDFEEEDFQSLRELIPAASGTTLIDAPLKAIKGVVISDADNPNMETNNQTGYKTIDMEDTYRTAYVESEDGQYGFRLRFSNKEDNTLERYSTVTISIDGLTLEKEANPGRYTIKGLKGAHIVEKIAGGASDLPNKSKSIGELTDEDVYTNVQLKDVSISVPYGSYMNVNRGYALKTNWNGQGTATAYVDAIPTNIYDANGDNMNMLVNASAPWALTTLPQNSGTISGIITHSELIRYGSDGNIGRYQIRPVNEHDIQLNNTSVATTLAEWNWLTSEGTNACATGSITQDGQGYVSPLIGDGKLSCTATGSTPSLGWNPICHSDPNSKDVYNNGLQYANVKWWDADHSKGEGFLLQFSTSDISAQAMMINFSINGGSGSDATNHIPVYWEIEYSLDGLNYTLIPNTDFTVRPLVQWDIDRPYESVGLTPYSFKLPNSILGKSDVYVKIKAKSAICAAVGSPSGGEAGQITSSMPGTTMRLGNLSIKYIQ